MWTDAQETLTSWPALQEQRLRQRNTETEDSLAKRLAAARADMDSSECSCPFVFPLGPS